MGARFAPIRVRTHGFRVLLATLLLTLLSMTVELGGTGQLLRVTLLSASLGAVLYAASQRRAPLVVGAALVGVALLGYWHDALGLPAVLRVWGLGAGALVFGVSTAFLWDPVFRSRRVTEDTLVGSVCLYLLLALAFAQLYGVAWHLTPEAFRSALPPSAESATTVFTYFSLVTMTTLGYGDMVPVHGAVRSLVILQSSIGILYPSIAVARIVAVHAAGGEAPPLAAADPAESRRARRVLALITAALLVPPWLSPEPTRLQALALEGALLVAIVYAVGQPRLRWMLLAPALASAALSWLGQRDPGGSLALAGSALGVLVFVVGLSIVTLVWMRADRVTGTVLYGSCSVYLLFGIAISETFRLLAMIQPDMLSTPSEALHLGELLYFAFMTLTTTGFGDISPISPAARLVASFAAGIGIFYPAILVGRLVSLYDVRLPESEPPG